MSTMMQGFPPAPGALVTLANWRTAPFNRWAFQHVRELVPTAEIRHNPVRAISAASAPQDLSGLSFPDRQGRTWALGDFLDTTNTDGLIVMQNGKIIHESYANGMTAGTPHFLASVSKSVLGLLAGILVEQRVLDPDCLVTDIVPELADTAYRNASLRHLLDMRAGIAFEEDYLATEGAIIEYRKATNWNPLEPGDTPSDLRSFFVCLRESDGTHGRAFHYVSPNTDLLGWVLERAAGARYADLISELIWQPMGASCPAYITVDRLGAARAAGGLCATARDLALVGQLLVDDGARGSTPVIPADWIADITGAGDQAAWQNGVFAPYFPGIDMHYRSKWYVRRGVSATLFGLGVHGQNLFVNREDRLVVAKFSSQAQPLDERLIDLTTRFFEALRLALRST